MSFPFRKPHHLVLIGECEYPAHSFNFFIGHKVSGSWRTIDL
jgi:hypothetical protein